MVMNQPFRFSAIFIWVLVLFSATIQTAHAQILPTSCSTTTMDMKLLVVSNGKTESDYPAIKQILDYLGTPYDVLDMTDRRIIRLRFSVADHQQLHVHRS